MQSSLEKLSLLKLTIQSNIALLTIDVPENKVNWLPEHFFSELNIVLDSIKTQSLKGVIITSAKKQHFIQGFDLDSFQDKMISELTQYSAFAQQVFNKLAELDIPTVSAINGHCFGVGLELALSYATGTFRDFTFCERNTAFSLMYRFTSGDSVIAFRKKNKAYGGITTWSDRSNCSSPSVTGIITAMVG